MKDYNGHIIEVVGIADVQVSYKGKLYELPLSVVKGNKNALFGLNWLKVIKLD